MGETNILNKLPVVSPIVSVRPLELPFLTFSSTPAYLQHYLNLTYLGILM